MTTTLEFLQKLYREENPKITLRFIEEPKPEDRRAHSTSKYGTFEQLKKYRVIAEINAYGTFFLVNPSGSEKTENVDAKESFAVFIDIDDDVLPTYFPVEPSAILSRSDEIGHHVYWFIEKNEDMEKWTLVQKILIGYYKSDKTIHNPARIMRLPGTHRFKSEPAMSYDVKKLNDNVYDIDTIVLKHQDPEERKKKARIEIKKIFKSGKLHDGEGRHRAIIKALFIMNDYGVENVDKELERINQTYMADEYTPEELKKFKDAQKYAKNDTGEKAIDEALAKAAKDEKIRATLEPWWYIYKTDVFVDIQNPTITRSTKGFSAQFSALTECVNAAGYVFRYDLIKRAEQFVYEPQKKTILQDKGITKINLWESPTLGEKEGNAEWFIDHINYLFEPDDAKHFIDYLAHMVQHPREKINHAILIISPKQGTGKSILVGLLKKIFGEKNVASPHNENLKENFTGWAKHCQLCFIHEILQADKKEFMNKIKPFISEDTITIREMYQPPYEITNYMHIIASTNHRLPILLETNDRRWAVLSSEVSAKEPAYYEKLAQNIEENAGVVLKYLKEYDLSGFNPKAHPRMTAAKTELIDQAKSDLEIMIRDDIIHKNPPFDFDLISAQDLYDSLPPRHQTSRTTLNRLTRILQECGAVRLQSRVRIEGTQRAYWAVRNLEHWKEIDAAGGIGDLIREHQAEKERIDFN